MSSAFSRSAHRCHKPLLGCRIYSGNGQDSLGPFLPSRPEEFHPEPLTDPDLNLSIHPARATERRLPSSVELRAPPGYPVDPFQRR